MEPLSTWSPRVRTTILPSLGPPHLLGIVGSEVGQDVLCHAVCGLVGMTDAAGQLGEHSQPDVVWQVLVQALHNRLYVCGCNPVLHHSLPSAWKRTLSQHTMVLRPFKGATEAQWKMVSDKNISPDEPPCSLRWFPTPHTSAKRPTALSTAYSNIPSVVGVPNECCNMNSLRLLHTATSGLTRYFATVPPSFLLSWT